VNNWGFSLEPGAKASFQAVKVRGSARATVSTNSTRDMTPWPHSTHLWL